MKQRDVVPLMSRLPADLHAALVARAQAEGRSLNGMLVAALRAGLEQEQKDAAAAAQASGGRQARKRSG